MFTSIRRPRGLALTLAAGALAATGCTSEPVGPEDSCLSVQKDISIDGGKTFLPADDVANAPMIAPDGAATYRLTVSNCGSTDIDSVSVTDEDLNLELEIALASAETRIFDYTTSSADGGSERPCYEWGLRARSRQALVSASIPAASAASGAIELTDSDVAWVVCDQDPGCGDGVPNHELGEECDAGDLNGGNECRDDCTEPVCGDGTVDSGEECDDANDDDDDYCRNDCTAPRCGDGRVDEHKGEECDDGNDNNYDECRDNCKVPKCGDWKVDPGEECDDGNTEDGDSCNSDCTLPVCGDGTVDPGEECDDGNTEDGDGCNSECKTPCCGDGTVDPGEECDDGNDDDDDGCRKDCSIPRCGDGTLDPGETCDDGNGNDYDYCRNDCTVPVCGDGIPDAGEACDDGNADNDDGCRNDCTSPLCGDGRTDPGEQCDDGNGNDYDYCRNDCTVPMCGDGIPDAGEDCDDGNDNDYDECRDDCTAPTCGDGIPDAGEACDDGNDNNDDECRNDCTEPSCGDGTVDPGEACDDGNADNGDGCRNDCTEPSCGDGTVDPGETCDDGNSDNGDGCSDTCDVEPEEDCDVEIDQTCRVVQQPTDGELDCEGKITAVVLEYTGEGCGATTNPQEGKSSCEGGSGGASPVSVVVTGKKGENVWGSDSSVSIGERVSASAQNGGEDKLDSDTIVSINNGLEVVTFHTSCSKPLKVGDKFGSIRVISITSTEGGTVSLPSGGGDGEGSDQCEVDTAQGGTECDGKLASLTLRYVGGDCSQSSQDQEGKLECEGDAGNAEPVRIVAGEKGKKDKKGKKGKKGKDDDKVYLDQDGVALGDLVTITAAGDKKKELKADTQVSVLDDAGNVLQTLVIHTSCSKPLALGDRFGAFEVVGFEGKKTSGSLVAEVEFSYTVTNPNDDTIVVDVVDDQFGVIAEDLPLEAGETVTLQRTAQVTETTTNTATVEAETLDGLVCEPATDSTEVILNLLFGRP